MKVYLVIDKYEHDALVYGMYSNREAAEKHLKKEHLKDWAFIKEIEVMDHYDRNVDFHDQVWKKEVEE